jgi:predicted acylesterase/phospholipase RssA
MENKNKNENENENTHIEFDQTLIKIININSLVISGGGVKGYLYLGAIKLFAEYGILNKIKYYYGTSVGGLIVTCLNLGWNIEETLKFTVGFPMDSIIEFDIDVFIDNYGLVPVKNYETLLKKIIKFKGFDENITFKQLYDMTKKELHLITYSLKDNNAIDLNFETMPDLEIWKALYMTSSLPVLIPPFEYKNNLYIDGGIIENFPMDRVKKENINKVIGINAESYKSDWEILKNKLADKDIINYLEYSLELIKIMFTKTIKFNTSNYVKLYFDKSIGQSTTVNLSIKPEIKQKIISDGYEQAKDQLPNIIKNIFNEQIDEYKNNHQNIGKKHGSKYNEI